MVCTVDELVNEEDDPDSLGGSAAPGVSASELRQVGVEHDIALSPTLSAALSPPGRGEETRQTCTQHLQG